MGDNIILYRGDFEKIKEFDFHKTDKWCLVGQGVYLTNTLDVANTYRTKGSSGRFDSPNEVIFSGNAKNIQDALDKAFLEFLKIKKLPVQPKTKQQQQQLHEARQEFNILYETGDIQAKYLTKVQRYNSNQVPTIEVRYPRAFDVGFISSFLFDVRELELRTYNVGNRVVTKEMIELCQEFGIDLKYKIDEDAKRSLWASPPTGERYLIKESYPKLRKALEHYGYKGFEYFGGVFTGSRRHRAFCIWDDAWLNERFIRRMQ